MNKTPILFAAVMLLVVCVSFAAEEGAAKQSEDLTRLVVLSLGNGKASSEQAGKMTVLLREAFSKTGLYYVLSQEEMNKRAIAAGESNPE